MEPIFVLVEYDPWQMAIGSDSPTFAIYDNGCVIYIRNGDQRQYCSVSLKGQKKVNLIDRLVPENVSTFKNYYELSQWTDQPTNLFYFNGYKLKVYGDLRSPEIENHIDDIFEDTDENEHNTWEDFPDEILDTFNTAVSFNHHEAVDWLPEKIEVMLWPYDYAPDPSIMWPEYWPDLNDQKTVKRGENGYSIFLPARHHMELINFLHSREPKGAIEINHKKMIVTFRFPFPNEDMWMNY